MKEKGKGSGEGGEWGADRQRNWQVNAQAFVKLPFSKLPFSFCPEVGFHRSDAGIDLKAIKQSTSIA